jgi:hypothetical protein
MERKKDSRLEQEASKGEIVKKSGQKEQGSYIPQVDYSYYGGSSLRYSKFRGSMQAPIICA